MAPKNKLEGEAPNLRVLHSFRGPESTHVPVGAVIPKAALDAGDWRTLLNMTPPKVAETFDDINDGIEDEDATQAAGLPVVV